MKKMLMALMLLLCVAALCGCTDNGGTRYGLNNGGAQYPGAEGVNPLAEEDNYDLAEAYPEVEIDVPGAPTNTPVPTVRSQYAGATPVLVEPIDKPTPTPVPKLSVTYQDYDATKLGLSFQAPAGWLVDDSNATAYVIQNPNQKIDYAATLTVTAEKVTNAYTTNNLKTVVNNMLDAVENFGFKSYSPSRTDTRELLGKTGVYANYSGTLETGERIAGRVHAVYVDKVVYTIHLSAPYEQWEDYKEMVYDHLRDTIKINK